MLHYMEKEITKDNSLQIITELNKELKTQADNPELLYILGRCYLLNKREKRALKYAKKAFEIDGNNDDYVTFLADCYLSQNNLVDAESYAKMAIGLNSQNIQAILLLSELELIKKDYTKAMSYAEQAVEINPTNFAAYRLKTKVNIQQSQPMEVLIRSIEISERYGQDEEMEYDRIHAYFIHGDYESCYSYYKKMLQTYPNSEFTQKAEVLIQEIQSNQFNGNDEEPINQNQLKKALQALDDLTGLGEVKEEINRIVKLVQYDQQRNQILGIETQKGPSYHFSFMGNPGTGKTTVARLLSEIFYQLEILKENKVIEVDRTDLVGEYIGQTGQKTKKVIEEAMGGVLFIDEAYSLAPDNQSGNDFGKEAVEVILKEMEDNRDELIVVFAGYTEEMKRLFKLNPGLKSRVNMNIHFMDYTEEELLEIAQNLAKENYYTLTEEAEKAFVKRINQEKVSDEFANARAVRNIIESAIRERAFRLGGTNISKEELLILETADFGIDPNELFGDDFEQLMAELDGLVGLDAVKTQVQSIINYIQIEKRRENDNGQSNIMAMHMLLTGNPGTGKTTVARLIGRVLKSIGVLKKGHLVEVTREDLVGQYVGQTALKTKDKVKEAYGGVLFIDEAYSLYSSSESDFGYEAISTLIKEMEDNRDKLIVIMAGYTKEMDILLRMNSGIKSRIAHTIEFPDYSKEELSEIYVNLAESKGFRLSEEAIAELYHLFERMISEKDEKFGNARLARNLFESTKLHQSNRLTKEANGDLYLIEVGDLYL